MAVRVVEEFFVFRAKSRERSRAVEVVNVWLACSDAWVAPIVRRMTERETKIGKRQKLYANK